MFAAAGKGTVSANRGNEPQCRKTLARYAFTYCSYRLARILPLRASMTFQGTLHDRVTQ